MSAQELYLIYAERMLDQGTGVDPWDELPIEDQNAWEAVAVAAS